MVMAPRLKAARPNLDTSSAGYLGHLARRNKIANPAQNVELGPCLVFIRALWQGYRANAALLLAEAVGPLWPK